jgi:hypothetical protein
VGAAAVVSAVGAGIGVAGTVVATSVGTGVGGLVGDWVHPATRIIRRIAVASKLLIINFLEGFMWQIKDKDVI